MKQVELVFCSGGERTQAAALELATTHLQPSRIHHIDGCQMLPGVPDSALTIQHRCDVVAYVDAAALIFEDLRPFLEFSEAPYVESVCKDRFWGRTVAGVRFARIDLVDAAATERRAAAGRTSKLGDASPLFRRILREKGGRRVSKAFYILNEFEQWYAHIFQRQALRQLRLRESEQRESESAMDAWESSPETRLARLAVQYVRERLGHSTTAKRRNQISQQLPAAARQAVDQLALAPQTPFHSDDATRLRDSQLEFRDRRGKGKIFGVGLGRTGTNSLTEALHILGFDVVHYPIDEKTIASIGNREPPLAVVDHYDGITDDTTVPFYQALARQFPASRFILTNRDLRSWLTSMKEHWEGKEDARTPRLQEFRESLRQQVYGCTTFDEQRLTRSYLGHHATVEDFFKSCPERLLTMNVFAGDGWDDLCRFLGRPKPQVPFPHRGKSKLP